jgi:hypothetical protein
MTEKKKVYLRLKGLMEPHEISGSLSVSGVCLNTSGPVMLQLINLFVCSEQSHNHFLNEEKASKPKAKKKPQKSLLLRSL